MNKSRHPLICALDIGSHKVACFIAELDEFYNPQLIGYGTCASHGMKRGMIVDMDRTEAAIASAVKQAEEMADAQVHELYVALGGIHLRSHMTDGLVVLNQHEIGQSDLEKIIDVARARQIEGDREIVHATATKYVLDSQTDIRDPRGMTGSRLEADVHIITAASAALRNVTRCVERAGYDVHEIVVQPLASAMSSLVDDERELGCALVDIGGGTCDIAIYSEGSLVYTGVIPVGGNHITADIARGLSTPLNHAERIKTLHGCAMAAALTDDQQIEIPHVGTEDDLNPVTITKSQLAGIIQPRCEELLEMVRDRIEQSGFETAIGRRVVLTGGTSQLAGLRQLAEVVLDKSVRLAKPQHVGGLTDLSGGPQFATSAGLVLYGSRQVAESARSRNFAGGAFKRMLSNTFSWLPTAAKNG